MENILQKGTIPHKCLSRTVILFSQARYLEL